MRNSLSLLLGIKTPKFAFVEVWGDSLGWRWIAITIPMKRETMRPITEADYQRRLSGRKVERTMPTREAEFIQITSPLLQYTIETDFHWKIWQPGSIPGDKGIIWKEGDATSPENAKRQIRLWMSGLLDLRNSLRPL